MPIDYKRYPKNWHSEIRPAVLARDNHCCQQCGRGNNDVVFVGILQGAKVWFSDYNSALRYCGPSVRRRGSKIIEYPHEVRVSLQIAHLDHDEENHDVSMDRLAALCQMCHHNYDAREKVRRRREKP